MSILLGIFIVCAFALFITVIFVIMRAASRGSREEERLRQRICQDCARERLMGEHFNDMRVEYGDGRVEYISLGDPLANRKFDDTTRLYDEKMGKK